jgi:hypothetical protein
VSEACQSIDFRRLLVAVRGGVTQRFACLARFWGSTMMTRNLLVAFAGVISTEPRVQLLYAVSVVLVAMTSTCVWQPWRTPVLNHYDTTTGAVLCFIGMFGTLFTSLQDEIRLSRRFGLNTVVAGKESLRDDFATARASGLLARAAWTDNLRVIPRRKGALPGAPFGSKTCALRPWVLVWAGIVRSGRRAYLALQSTQSSSVAILPFREEVLMVLVGVFVALVVSLCGWCLHMVLTSMTAAGRKRAQEAYEQPIRELVSSLEDRVKDVNFLTNAAALLGSSTAYDRAGLKSFLDKLTADRMTQQGGVTDTIIINEAKRQRDACAADKASPATVSA